MHKWTRAEQRQLGRDQASLGEIKSVNDIAPRGKITAER
jgi:hypothetical protein